MAYMAKVAIQKGDSRVNYVPMMMMTLWVQYRTATIHARTSESIGKQVRTTCRNESKIQH